MDRVRKFRRNLRADSKRYEEHLLKERTRDAKRREKKRQELVKNEDEFKKNREREAKRKRLQRKKKREAKVSGIMNSPEIKPYQCVQTLGKAVHRAKKALPSTPRRKAAVVRKLIAEDKSIPAEVRKILFRKDSVKSTKNSLPEETKKKVINFYLSDRNSWQAPGRKDTMPQRCPLTKKRVHVPKRYLIFTVSELYELFRQAYPECPIKLSKFFELRPSHVLIRNKLPQNVCTCIHHENFKYLVECLSRQIKDFPCRISLVLNSICCDITNESCMRNNCNKCQSLGTLITEEMDGSTIVKYRKWKDNKAEKRMTLVEIQSPLVKVVNTLQEVLPTFKTHHFNYLVQTEAFQKARNSIIKTSAVMQIDFAEKFAIKYQDEAQSAYWGRKLIMIFTCSIWSAGGTKCYAVLSEYKTQDKYTVWCFLNIIFSQLKETQPNIKSIEIYSDGASSQFKNKWTLSNIVFCKAEFQLDVSWQFFASYHGKGAVDGIGATVKQALWSAIRTREIIFQGAKDCQEYLEKKITGVKTLVATSEEILAYKKLLDKKWENMRAIPRIKQMHCLNVEGGDSIRTKYCKQSEESFLHKVMRNPMVKKRKLRVADVYSASEDEGTSLACQSNEEFPKNTSNTDNMLKEGAFVLVKIKSNNVKNLNLYRYVGIIQDIDLDEDEVKVLFLQRIPGNDAKTFKTTEDLSYVSIENIVRFLEYPKLVMRGNRMYYNFDLDIDVFEKPC